MMMMMIVISVVFILIFFSVKLYEINSWYYILFTEFWLFFFRRLENNDYTKKAEEYPTEMLSTKNKVHEKNRSNFIKQKLCKHEFCTKLFKKLPASPRRRVETVFQYFSIYTLLSSIYMIQRCPSIVIPARKKVAPVTSKTSSTAQMISSLLPKWQPCWWGLSLGNGKGSYISKSGV